MVTRRSFGRIGALLVLGPAILLWCHAPLRADPPPDPQAETAVLQAQKGACEGLLKSSQAQLDQIKAKTHVYIARPTGKGPPVLVPVQKAGLAEMLRDEVWQGNLLPAEAKAISEGVGPATQEAAKRLEKSIADSQEKIKALDAQIAKLKSAAPPAKEPSDALALGAGLAAIGKMKDALMKAMESDDGTASGEDEPLDPSKADLSAPGEWDDAVALAEALGNKAGAPSGAKPPGAAPSQFGTQAEWEWAVAKALGIEKGLSAAGGTGKPDTSAPGAGGTGTGKPATSGPGAGGPGTSAPSPGSQVAAGGAGAAAAGTGKPATPVAGGGLTPVPNVVGWKGAEALSILSSRGWKFARPVFEPAKPSSVPPKRAKEYTVESQFPKAGTPADQATARLKLWTYGKFAVPDITGKTQKEAEAALAEAELKGVLDGVDGSHDDSYKPKHLHVKSQTPSAGSDIPADQVVKYTIFKYLDQGLGDHFPPIDNPPAGRTSDLVGVWQGEVEEIRQGPNGLPVTLHPTLQVKVIARGGKYTILAEYVRNAPPNEQFCHPVHMGELENSTKTGFSGVLDKRQFQIVPGDQINAEYTIQATDGRILERRKLQLIANQGRLGIRAERRNFEDIPTLRETTTITSAIGRVSKEP